MEKCPNCKEEISESLEKCATCGRYLGAPNVRAASKKVEVVALAKRCRAVKKQAKQNGSRAALAKFEKAMHGTGAVMNLQLEDINYFFSKDRNLYSTYALQVKGQIRKPADLEDDRKRLTVEAYLFGNYAQEIRYAALSLDGAGVKSYGDYALKLKDIAIRDRASLLEENSFFFAEKLPANHNLTLLDPIPRGCRAAWKGRRKLAVAKLGRKITAATDEKEFAKILLQSEGNRQTDDFIEVFIYGSFDRNAVESIRGSSKSTSKFKRASLVRIKGIAAKAGISWVEE